VNTVVTVEIRSVSGFPFPPLRTFAYLCVRLMHFPGLEFGVRGLEFGVELLNSDS
jgi:hypothetical protein